jgi:hypothetical protein
MKKMSEGISIGLIHGACGLCLCSVVFGDVLYAEFAALGEIGAEVGFLAAFLLKHLGEIKVEIVWHGRIN